MGRSPWTLQGRTMLVTGGTRGIGRAIAAEAVALGARIAVVARRSGEIEERVSAWRATGADAHGIVADISEPAGRQRIVREMEALGRLDALVNNAGSNIRKSTDAYEPEEIARLTAVNQTAALELTRMLRPMLRDSGESSVVNIVSVSGLVSTGTGVAYAMAKAAVIQMTRYLAVEWAPDRIRVNAVAPWYTRTPLAEQVLARPEFRDAVLERTPIGRVAEPEEVARAALFLCMPAAAYITGACLPVDGGFTSKGFAPPDPPAGG